ncbi:hypothetical protein CDAR_206471 [Caerostris darwini]|uniref:Uncharacterized protein n=1 Tax=Caerostris darwini TaxID=1538125 RepID=A0AAV4PG97_9ARAC|nr:hypothetical protein CDAR_206471 [Caerostris darwini]
MDDGHRKMGGRYDAFGRYSQLSSVVSFPYSRLLIYRTEYKSEILAKLTKIPLIAVVQRINDDSFMVDLRYFNGFERSSFRKCSR